MRTVTKDIDEANRIIHILRGDLRDAQLRFFAALAVIVVLGAIIVIQHPN